MVQFNCIDGETRQLLARPKACAFGSARRYSLMKTVKDRKKRDLPQKRQFKRPETPWSSMSLAISPLYERLTVTSAEMATSSPASISAAFRASGTPEMPNAEPPLLNARACLAELRRVSLLLPRGQLVEPVLVKAAVHCSAAPFVRRSDALARLAR